MLVAGEDVISEIIDLVRGANEGATNKYELSEPSVS